MRAPKVREAAAARARSPRAERIHLARSVDPLTTGTCACGGGCPSCVRRTPRDGAAGSARTGSVRSAMGSSSSPLPAGLRMDMETALGADLSGVRVHDDAAAHASAQAVQARAYTVGSDVVFGRGQFAPHTSDGRRLVAHELAHVAQAGRGASPVVARATAAQVSCAPGPLNVPGAPPLSIADPVAVITAAETTAQGWLDDMIAEIDFTQGRIAAGAPLAWPTVSDALFVSLRIIGVNPSTRAAWTGARSSVGRVLANLRTLRAGVGAANLRYTCLGPQSGTIGSCTGPLCSVGVLGTCPGARRIVMCRPFWRDSTADDQAARMVHENVHRVLFIRPEGGRRFNPECFARMVQYYAGVTPTRPDLCAAVPEETP